MPKGEGSKSQRHFYWDIAISLMFITVLHIAHRIALIENRILLPAYRSYNAVESERPNKMMVTIFCKEGEPDAMENKNENKTTK